MHIGTSKMNLLSNRACLVLVLILLLVQAKPAAWAQDKEWDKHMKAGNRASKSFKYEKAEKEFQAALARTQTFPPTDLRTAETLSKLASLYAEESKFTDAEIRQKQAVAIFEASAAPDDLRLACAQIGLAMIYQFEGKREEAAPIWDRFFPILEKPARPVDPAVFSAMIDLRSELRDLAMLYARQKQGSDVEAAETTILAIDETAFGPDGLETGNDAQSLGQHYERQGEYGAAFPLLMRKLEITRKASRNDSSVSARTYKDAVTALDVMIIMPEVLLFHENVPGPFLDPHWGHAHELLGEYRELAKVGAESGKYHEAAELYQQIIPLDEKHAGSNKWHDIRGLADDLMDLARVYRHEKRYDDAVDTIQRSEMADERAAKAKYTKPEQVSLLHWYGQNELAEIDREKGDLAAAKSLFEQSLEMVGKVPLGAGHPRIAELLSDYAGLLADEGKFDEAESFYKRALDTWAKSWYPEQLEHAETLASYAGLLRKLNRPSEAEPLEARASAIRTKVDASEPVN
jgi:tetratricopeptide (TPR) repeat protein